MIYIAHRGLMYGPNKEIENHPDQIELALSKGYDCEIDLWKMENKYFLGHDGPEYDVDLKFLSQQGLWIHCKNLNALHDMSTQEEFFNYFWHQSDDFTLTSSGIIWTYPGKNLTNNSVCVVPERYMDINQFKERCFGVCSDYVGEMI